jgi:hypothetical protein
LPTSKDMKLRARVKRTTGNTRHYIGTFVEGELMPVADFPPTAYVEIHEGGDGGYMLFHYDNEGQEGADTWHPTLDEAKEQAKFEYEIEEADWKVVED